ncbi:MAG TPA: hypothetical protein VFJ19_06245 [Nocardioidaceae bacterium]|nr:hypothetical protein [Nocardioidaceae bacterium]
MTSTATPGHIGGSAPRSMRPLRSAWRWPAIITILVAGAVHIPVTPMHLEEAPYIGWLFIVLTVACFVLAVGLAAFDTGAIWLASGVATALAVIAYVLSRTVGLPQIGDDVGNWLEPLGVAAIVTEALTAAIAVRVLMARKTTRVT